MALLRFSHGGKLALEKCNNFVYNGNYLHLYPRFLYFFYIFVLVSETIDSGLKVRMGPNP